MDGAVANVIVVDSFSLVGHLSPFLCRELNGNNITRINKNDFSGLKQLRVLQLMENHISVVERGVFDDMKELERLRLNRNQLHTLPELLFQNNQALSRL
uniref:Uncharacterized protein n=1 Tax=Sphaerodactylus townsendi TaxID=933632 RepID=A0ACB8F9K1_9SAUR